MPNLIETLEADLHRTKRELSALEEQERLLRWKVQYIEALLTSSGAPVSPLDGGNGLGVILHDGLKIGDAAIEVLRAAGEPLSCMEIARRATAAGFARGIGIERARSHFSAVISKELRSDDSRFWQVDRGKIGLAEWRKAEELTKLLLESPELAPNETDH